MSVLLEGTEIPGGGGKGRLYLATGLLGCFLFLLLPSLLLLLVKKKKKKNYCPYQFRCCCCSLVWLNCLLNCLWRGTGGDRDPRRWWKRETIPSATQSVLPPEWLLHWDESHFNVSFTVKDKVTKTVSTDHNVWRAKRAETESNQGLSAY